MCFPPLEDAPVSLASPLPPVQTKKFFSLINTSKFPLLGSTWKQCWRPWFQQTWKEIACRKFYLAFFTRNQKNYFQKSKIIQHLYMEPIQQKTWGSKSNPMDEVWSCPHSICCLWGSASRCHSGSEYPFMDKTNVSQPGQDRSLMDAEWYHKNHASIPSGSKGKAEENHHF